MENLESKEDILIKERKRKILDFFTKNYNWPVYIVLLLIVFITVKIRTLNIYGLKDITTGSWTLGPDLDPFLFLRWAKYIVGHGSLMAVDTLRYVPLGFETRSELVLLPYLIAGFHNMASFFGSTSIEYSAIIFPVFMFVLTIIAFFFLVRKLFIDNLGELKANIIALISVFFLSVIPAILPRTIAGIPEKESAAFFFMFLSFYIFLSAWKSKSIKSQLFLAFLAALSTAAMSSIWGGGIYIFLAISITTLLLFISGQVDKHKTLVYAVWLLVSFALMNIFSSRNSLENLLLLNINISSSFFVLIILGMHLLIFSTGLKKYFESERIKKIPSQFVSLIITLIFGFVAVLIIKGPSFFSQLFSKFYVFLVAPADSRLIQTVAESRQPFFGEWASSYGPVIGGSFPIFFYLFLIGSVCLFYNVVKPSFNRKESSILTFGFAFLLLAMIFSRYSSSSVLNGSSAISLIFYASGFLLFLFILGFFYYKNSKLQENNMKNLDFGFVMIFVFFFFAILSARGAVRLIMMLAPPGSIFVSYLLVSMFNNARKHIDEKKMFAFVLFGIIALSAVYSGISFYKESAGTAKSYIPSVYTQQWQKAMSWVRESTPENAVFAHWWDYGYWLQSIGERATVLDGGNAISYWNHLMGRYALTGTDNTKALEFLYAHNVTHFLIDSTDIGKYSAFSKIGSDKSYDRESWIPAFIRDNRQVEERKNSTVFVYAGGSTLDTDIIYDKNGTKIFLPAGKAVVAAIVIEKDKSNKLASQPYAVMIYQNKNQNNQYNLPLKYAYDDGFIDYNSGIEAGIFLFPVLNPGQNGYQIDDDGALLYLSQ